MLQQVGKCRVGPSTISLPPLDIFRAKNAAMMLPRRIISRINLSHPCITSFIKRTPTHPESILLWLENKATKVPAFPCAEVLLAARFVSMDDDCLETASRLSL